MYVWNTLVTICCSVCYAFTGNFCWLCQVIHQTMVHACHVKKSKYIDQGSCASVLNSVSFWEHLKNFEFSYIEFCWRTHCQDAQRKLRRQRVTWACALVTRDYADDVVTQFSDIEDENHDVQIEIPTDNAYHASADMPGIADLLVTTILILCRKTHVHAVENTDVEVMAGGDSERCEKLYFFENWCWENSWLQKLKNGFWSNLSLLFDF